MSLISFLVFVHVVRVSTPLSNQNEVEKINDSKKDFFYRNDCSNYAPGLTPNPLRAVNLPSFCIRSLF